MQSCTTTVISLKLWSSTATVIFFKLLCSNSNILLRCELYSMATVKLLKLQHKLSIAKVTCVYFFRHTVLHVQLVKHFPLKSFLFCYGKLKLLTKVVSFGCNCYCSMVYCVSDTYIVPGNKMSEVHETNRKQSTILSSTVTHCVLESIVSDLYLCTYILLSFFSLVITIVSWLKLLSIVSQKYSSDNLIPPFYPCKVLRF